MHRKQCLRRVSLGLFALSLLGAGGCGPEEAGAERRAQATHVGDGDEEVVGTVEYIVTTDENLMTLQTAILLRVPGRAGLPLQVHFPHGQEPAGLKSGDVLAVRGRVLGNAIAAVGASVQSASTTTVAAAAAGAQNVIVLPVYNLGTAPPTSPTQAQLQGAFFSATPPSVRSYWEEASKYDAALGRGITAAGTVLPWMELDGTYDPCNGYYALRDAAIRAADATVDFTQYNRIFIIVDAAGCGWAGLGTIGSSSLSSADGGFVASTSWIHKPYGTNVGVDAHEGGHNLGMHHASSEDFSAEALGPIGVRGTLSEYGDPFGTMGSGSRHYNGPHQARVLGWLGGGSYQVVDGQAATVTLRPLEEVPGAGVQVVKVRRGTGNNEWLWLEYRRPLGYYDSTLSGNVISGALVHREVSSADLHTYLVGFSEPTSFSSPALTGSWSDPYSNLSLFVHDATATSLSVDISYSCVRRDPTLSLSPSPADVVDGAAQLTLRIANQDGACAPRTFDLASALPDGWTTALSSPSLTVAAGGNGTVTLTKTAPPGVAPGDYTVTATADDGLNALSASATARVMDPIQVAITSPAPGAVYTGAGKQGKAISYSASVRGLQGGAAVSGASVSFTLEKASTSRGGVVTWKQVAASTQTSGSDGVATWTYTTKAGDYRLSAAASKAGQSDGTDAPTSFRVTQ